MTHQLDIEEVLRRTAHAFKAPGTSAEAVRAAAPASGRLCELTLASLKRGPKSPEEVAMELGRDILSIRPRFSQLYDLGLIEKTGDRRKSANGRSVTVWRVTAQPQQVAA